MSLEMSMNRYDPNPTTVLMSFSLEDFCDDASEPDDDIDYEPDDDIDCECPVDVEPLGNQQFRVITPTSLTPFGPLGPMLNRGDVIELTSREDGNFRYVRTVKKSRVWSKRLTGPTIRLPIPPSFAGSSGRSFRDVPTGVRVESIKSGEARRILDELVESHTRFNWEWAVGNLTLQFELEPGETEPPQEVIQKVRELGGLL
jgi:hypothetical protein